MIVNLVEVQGGLGSLAVRSADRGELGSTPFVEWAAEDGRPEPCCFQDVATVESDVADSCSHVPIVPLRWRALGLVDG
jgi:hypothetical protein